jgi:hypothetical protein
MSANRRYYNDKGQVGVLVSPGFGAGWSTWENGVDVFDYEMIEAVLTKQRKGESEKIARSKYPNAYLGGVADLTVKFVNSGTKFHIREYDGYETLETIDDIDWLEA